MTKLSKNFTLAELTKSSTASRHGIPNKPNTEQIQNLSNLVTNLLQPLRDKVGPIFITSGFRSPKLNSIIKGNPNSQHMKGQAVDIESSSKSTYSLAKYIIDNLDFDQIILENWDPSDMSSGWVHVSWNSPTSNRRQVLESRVINGRTVYFNGLPKQK